MRNYNDKKAIQEIRIAKVIVQDCYDECIKRHDEDLDPIQKEKAQEKLQKKQDHQAQDIITNIELQTAQCGQFTEVDPKSINCPSGVKAYKYHYNAECRSIKTYKSKDPIQEAKNYNLSFCSTKKINTIAKSRLKK